MKRIAWLLACACEGGSAVPADAGGDAPPTSDAGRDAPRDDRVRIDATDGVLALPFSVDIAGSGSGLVGTIAIEGAVGAVGIGGQPIDAVVYERIPWPEYGLTLFQALAVVPDRWFVLWFYCDGADLDTVYFEGTDGTPLAYEVASGTCTEGAGPAEATVQLPAVDMALPTLVEGYTVEGEDVSIPSGAEGWVRLGASEPAVLVFEDVDCTECGSDPWYELHAILWDRAGARACFGIFYLLEGEPVLLAYSLTLPDLTDPAGETWLPATWTAP